MTTAAQRDRDRLFIEEGAARAAAMLRVLGNEHRLLVLCLLIEHRELSVGALLERVPLSQSALSQHLAKMREEGLVGFRREAQTLYYRIENQDVARLVAVLKAIFCP
ncbi:MAG: helix-turn-helix transcriptional regulator [Limnobacter sp.]|nr:helix-turn-helix transcriptional regulator [Limnobacter sp.]